MRSVDAASFSGGFTGSLSHQQCMSVPVVSTSSLTPDAVIKKTFLSLSWLHNIPVILIHLSLITVMCFLTRSGHVEILLGSPVLISIKE